MSLNAPVMHAAGPRAYNDEAGWKERAPAFFVDVCAALAIACGIILKLDMPPFTTLWVWLLFAGWMSISLFLSRVCFGRSIGEWLWKLEFKPAPHSILPLRGKVLRPSRITSASIIASTLGSAIAFSASVWLSAEILKQHPIWKVADPFVLDAYLPPLAPLQDRDRKAAVGIGNREEWIVAPFFYSLGAWPKTFRGRPVFYSVPYEKGPPTRFVGHIVARWDLPDTRVTFEGPKTPVDLKFKRTEVNECVLSIPGSPSCLKIRDQLLTRHLSEMRRIKPYEWSLKWFRVRNAALPAEEEAQGVFISALSPALGQERFIFVTPKGTHQAVILEYPRNPTGEEARELFEQAVRTLRVSDDLGPGRAWVDAQLQAIDLAKADDILQLAGTQALLAAKISVDPKNFDAFFHLGGASLLLAKMGKLSQTPEWRLSAQPTIQTIQSAHKFAQDISPSDPRTTQLEQIWLEAKKTF